MSDYVYYRSGGGTLYRLTQATKEWWHVSHDGGRSWKAISGKPVMPIKPVCYKEGKVCA